MVIFGAKKNTEKKAEVKAAPKTRKTEVVPTQKSLGNYPRAILQPRITEKASFLAETKNVYVFEVETFATKRTVAEAVKALYKVTAQKVRMARNPSKKVFLRGKWGTKTGVKKAYVYLAKGDKIEIA